MNKFADPWREGACCGATSMYEREASGIETDVKAWVFEFRGREVVRWEDFVLRKDKALEAAGPSE